MAIFKVSELFTKREVEEMQDKIKIVDDFMEYMNEFHRRSKIENFVPFDLITNGEFEPILSKINKICYTLCGNSCRYARWDTGSWGDSRCGRSWSSCRPTSR